MTDTYTKPDEEAKKVCSLKIGRHSRIQSTLTMAGKSFLSGGRMDGNSNNCAVFFQGTRRCLLFLRA